MACTLPRCFLCLSVFLCLLHHMFSSVQFSWVQDGRKLGRKNLLVFWLSYFLFLYIIYIYIYIYMAYRYICARECPQLCAPPRFSGVYPMLPLKQFQCWSDWLWTFLFPSRKIAERFLFLRLSPLLSSRMEWLKSFSSSYVISYLCHISPVLSGPRNVVQYRLFTWKHRWRVW